MARARPGLPDGERAGRAGSLELPAVASRFHYRLARGIIQGQEIYCGPPGAA